MFTAKFQRTIHDRIAGLQSRLHGLIYKSGLDFGRPYDWPGNQQAVEVRAHLQKAAEHVRRAQIIASRTPQERVADSLKQRLDSDNSIGTDWPGFILKDAWLIAAHWPYNTTGNDWWNPRNPRHKIGAR